MGKRKTKPSYLLPANALSGIRLGVSVSESPDLLRLGLLETHFRLALGEIARCVLVSGGHLAYGGHLDPDGYTAFLIRELERYSRRDRPLRICLAWPEHRKMPLGVLNTQTRDLGLYGEIVYLDPSGAVIQADTDRGEAPTPVEPGVAKESLSGLRRYMAKHTQGRVLIGGKRSGFEGNMPGVLEEALFAVEQGQPVYLAGGFGGITSDIARQLGIDNSDWFRTREDAPAADERVERGMAELGRVAEATMRQSLENGLTDEENRRLAACYRPSEIAALVSLGLGRKFQRKRPR